MKVSRIPKPAYVAPTTHIGHDLDRRRKIIYSSACPACQLDDEKRRTAEEPQVKDEDLYRTIFLIPDYNPERQIAELYLKRRYPGAVNVGSSLNYKLVPQMPDIMIVVIARRAKPGYQLTPFLSKVLRADNKWEDVAVPHSELVAEVLESAVILVGDTVKVSPQSLIMEQAVDVSELVERIAEVAGGYRVFKQNPPDQLIVLQME
jgi:hypothetical protein